MNIQDIPPAGTRGGREEEERERVSGKFTLSVDSYDQTFHGIDILLR